MLDLFGWVFGVVFGVYKVCFCDFDCVFFVGKWVL